MLQTFIIKAQIINNISKNFVGSNSAGNRARGVKKQLDDYFVIKHISCSSFKHQIFRKTLYSSFIIVLLLKLFKNMTSNIKSKKKTDSTYYIFRK